MVARKADLKLDEKARKKLQDIKRRPEQFIRMSHVEDYKNELRFLRDFWPEQRLWIRALVESKQVLGLKPRQMGFTTITCLFFLWKAITTKHPKKSLQIVHEDQAVFRMAKMLRVAVAAMPAEIRPRFKTDNIVSTIFSRIGPDGEEIDGAQFSRMLAGGSGQARSWTYNNIHATEMAHWRRATASNPSNGDGLSADEEAFASALATKHDPDGHIVVESTGNGPSGLFYDLYQRAQRESSSWSFVFIPWTAVERYELPLTDDEARLLEADLDEYEHKLYKKGVSLNKLAWRRWKKDDIGLSELAWRRNYPLTSMEPFLLDDLVWFNAEALQVQMANAETHISIPQNGDLRVFIPYEPGRVYVCAVDTSGGTGRDESVITVFRDDLVQVCIWATNKAPPPEQALWISRISQMYHQPLTLIEENKYGKVVIPLVEAIGGVRLWLSDEGKNFTTTETTRRIILSNARELIDGDMPIIMDTATIVQLQNYVEFDDGVVRVRSGHDDRSMATILALYCWLRLRFSLPSEQETERQRLSRLLDQYRINGI